MFATLPDPPRSPAWGWQEVGMLLGAVLPSLLLGAALLRAGQWVAPGVFGHELIRTAAFQTLFYLFMLGALYVLIALRYGQPFWRSLNWRLSFRGAWLCLAVAPFIAFSGAAMGVALKIPEIQNPIAEMITDRTSLIGVMVFAVVIGPVWEEIMFRGFLFPVLQRSLGGWAAIFLTALPFALVHGAQNQWAWQALLIVGLAGVAFGYARYRTGSTAASTLMHMGYNATLFLVVLIQRF